MVLQSSAPTCAWSSLPIKSAIAAIMLSVFSVSGIQAAKETATDSNETSASARVEIVEIKGKVLAEDELSSYAMVLEQVGEFSEDMNTVLNDYILSELADEVYTTITEEKQAPLPTKYTNFAQRGLIKNAFIEKVKSGITVPQDELERWHKENLHNYQQPERVHGHHLFMETSSDVASSAPEVVRKRMSEVKAEADKGTSFGLLAEKYSEAASGKNGGDIGVLTRRMPIGPESRPMNLLLENALFSLDTGKVSNIVETSHGLHLMYAKEHVTTITPTLQDMITSGILPGGAIQNRLTSTIVEMRQNTLKKYNGKVVLTTVTGELTTDTPALAFDSKTFTLDHLERLYGLRFKRAFERVVKEKMGLENLLTQVLDDEAMVRAAIDYGVDSDPELQRKFKLLEKRAKAHERIQKIIAEVYPTTEAQARELYEANKEAFRLPEASGEFLLIQPNKTPTLRERAAYEAKVKSVAELAHSKAKEGKELSAIAKELATEDITVSASKVAKHVIGDATDPTARQFDYVAPELSKPGELSELRAIGNSYVIALLKERSPGSYAPFDVVKPRFLQQSRIQNEQRAKSDMLNMLEAKGLVKWLPGAAKFGRAPGGVNEGNKE